MEIRDFSLKLKALADDSGAFEGIACPYGDPPDLQGDVISPGSFSQAIRQQGRGYPLLWSHKQDEPLGVARIEDSSAGLLVRGQMVMSDPIVQRVHAFAKIGAVRGISIGYRVPEGKSTYRDDGARVINEIFLLELSIVAIPAAPRAQITTIKSLGDVRHALKSLSANVSGDEISELLEIDRELKRLLAGRDPAEIKAATLRELQAFHADLQRIAGAKTANECECECEQCQADNCAECSNAECVDENCIGCPNQEGV
jgi:HK97 family phage prohead protease